MERTPDAFADAVGSGDPDQVNAAIDAVEDMDPSERVAIYDECFERCLPHYESGDGYTRQSVVRFLRDAYPMLELRQVGSEALDAVDAPSADYDEETLTAQRDRLWEFLVRALTDDDGRVRQAATKGINTLATTALTIDIDAELQAAEELLTEMLAEHDDGKRKHIEEARGYVRRHLVL